VLKKFGLIGKRLMATFPQRVIYDAKDGHKSLLELGEPSDEIRNTSRHYKSKL